ncbi:MAG: hypothetical protein R6V85_03920 [Polyangia bacterium]
MRILLAVVTSALLVAGLYCCATEPSDGPGPLLSEVVPAEGQAGAEQTVTIRGDELRPALLRDADCSGNAGAMVDDDFDAELGDHGLLAVSWIATDRLTGRVPADLEPGTYDLVVVDPHGRVGSLPDAYTVLAGSDGDVDADADADTDADTDTDGPNSCQNPHAIDAYPTQWSGQWSDYENSFAPSNECGSGDRDIWFAAFVPAGATLTVEEIGAADVLLRHVESCTSFACIDWTDEPEQLAIPNPASDAWIRVVVTETALGAQEPPLVVFDLQP